MLGPIPPRRRSATCRPTSSAAPTGRRGGQRRLGVDILLAPPRPELAELITARDLEQLLGVLRRACQAIVIDTPPTLSESTLAFLDAADLVIDVTTAEPAALEVTGSSPPCSPSSAIRPRR
jgi:pilus assembly protein CpaE